MSNQNEIPSYKDILSNTETPKEEQKENADQNPEIRLKEAISERVRIEKEIDTTLKTYERSLSAKFNLKAPENIEDTKALNLFKQVQLLRAKMIGANVEKLEQLVLEFNNLNGRVAEFLPEENSTVESQKKIDSQRIRVAFNKPSDVEIQDVEQKIQVSDPENPSSSDNSPEATPVDSDLNEKEEVSPTVDAEMATNLIEEKNTDTLSENEDDTSRVSSVDELLGVTTSLDENVSATLKKVAENQRTDEVNNILAVIFGRETAPRENKLLRQMQKKIKDNLSPIKNVYADSNQANLVFELQDASKKFVSLEALAALYHRGFDHFVKKLPNMPEYQEQVHNIDFSEPSLGKSEPIFEEKTQPVLAEESPKGKKARKVDKKIKALTGDEGIAVLHDKGGEVIT